MAISVSHLSRYRFTEPAAFGLFQLRQRPRSSDGHTVLEWELALEGGRVEAEFIDHHGNAVTLASLEPGAEALSVRAQGVVEVEDRAGVQGPHAAPSPLWLYERQTSRTEPGPAIEAILAEARRAETELARMHALCQTIHARVRYEPGRTHVETTAEEAARAGHGVCQDHAHIFCGAARTLGIPARYVSGYLLLPSGEGADASHAWAEAHIDGLGWVGFDPANAVCPDSGYVRTACGLDYAEAAPIHGLVSGASGDLSVCVDVRQQQQQRRRPGT